MSSALGEHFELQLEIRALIHDQLKLVMVELRLAAQSFVAVVATSAGIGALLLMAWAGLMAAIGLGLVRLGVDSAIAMLAVTVLISGLALLLGDANSNPVRSPGSACHLACTGAGDSRIAKRKMNLDGTDTPRQLTGRAPALIRQISELEKQLARRRQSVRLQVTGFRQKVNRQLITPAVLLAAVGVGVTLEQGNHRKFWSVAALLSAVNSGLGLLSTFKSPLQERG